MSTTVLSSNFVLLQFLFSVAAVSKSAGNPSGSVPLLFLTALLTVVKSFSYTISVLDSKNVKAQ